MSKAKARVFVPLTKVDEEQRLVYGTITQEVIDQSGEVMDYESSKPNFEKWSSEAEERSGGLSKGNLRVMHGLNVAGKLTDLAFNDDDKTIEVCAKVVDDGEWEKVLEGCYTGFSVGGKYGKKWNEVVDGQQIKKYTAVPNEVSLVDNPCVKSATFSLVKADGAEESIMFKVSGEQQQSEEPVETEAPAQPQITNEQVAARATELAKAANDGSDWTSHIEAAREELTKAAKPKAKDKKDDDEAAEGEEGKDKSAAKDSEEEKSEGEVAKSAEKLTPAGVKQKWETSDGQTFEKKSDAVAHEEELAKAAQTPKTEAELLAERLEKALTPEEPVAEEEPLPVELDYFDRMAKVFNALSTPFEGGEPKLEKGMYTVNRFSNVLSDLGALIKSIAAEGVTEGDETDTKMSSTMKAQLAALGESFKAYVSLQVTELLSGIDDDVVVCYHDYYYRAAQENGEDQLAKDVVAAITEHREDAMEKRETLAKAFGIGEEENLSDTMQKRFDELSASNENLRKVATAAVEKVEELAKKVQEIENQPTPRAPTGHLVPKEGESFLGKAASTEAEKLAVLEEMLKTHGPEGMATMLIKAQHATGGQKLSLRQ